jgi:hypothetical protein
MEQDVLMVQQQLVQHLVEIKLLVQISMKQSVVWLNIVLEENHVQQQKHVLILQVLLLNLLVML